MNTFISTVSKKVKTLPTLTREVFLSSGLFIFLTIQLSFSGLFNERRPPHMPEPNSISHSLQMGGWEQSLVLRTFISLVIIAIACSALIFRKRAPWSVLIATTLCAALYTVMPLNPVFIVITPLIAIYNVTSSSAKNTRWVIIFIISALALCLFALTYATSRWAIELVGFTLLLAAGALFGSVRRSDLAYIHEAEERALEAERTREQEAQKRVEIERVAIAREVHDIVAHSISIIAIQSAAADTLIDSQPQAAHEAVNNIRETSKQALTELRGMINVLRNDATNLTPLAPIASLPAVEEIVERVRAAGIDVHVNNNTNEFLPAPVSVSAYRIIQEALTNILRHSNAKTVEIRIEQGPHELRLEIKDDGVYDPSDVNRQGHGLQGMRERCEALGGAFETSSLEASSAGTVQGFTIHATLPLSRSQK